MGWYNAEFTDDAEIYDDVMKTDTGRKIYREGYKDGLQELEGAIDECFRLVENEFLNNPYISESEDEICEQKVHLLERYFEQIKKEYTKGKDD